jgi:hypothetical protein
MLKSRHPMTAAALTCMILSAPRIEAATLLVSNLFEPTFSDGRIEIVQTDGSGRQVLRDVGGGLRGVDVDVAEGYVYWSDVDTVRIDRISLSNLVGEPEGVITSDLGFPQDLRLSTPAGKLLWTDTTLRQIQTSGMDGSGIAPVFSALSTTIAMDLDNQKIYAENRTSASRGAIVRFDLDGSNFETVIDDVPTATSLAVDPAHGYVFWTSSSGLSDGNGGVYRVNFDGSDFREIFLMGSNLDAAGIAVDGEYVYWGQESEANRSDIYRMRLDGTAPEVVAQGYGLINTLILVPDFPALPLTVAIDIRPGNDKNIINTRSKGQIWVAVLSDLDTAFDPLQVDIPSIGFGPNGASASHHRVQDVNNDGAADLLLRFAVPDTGIASDDASVALTGATYHGQALNGIDTITTVGQLSRNARH